MEKPETPDPQGATLSFTAKDSGHEYLSIHSGPYASENLTYR